VSCGALEEGIREIVPAPKHHAVKAYIPLSPRTSNCASKGSEDSGKDNNVNTEGAEARKEEVEKVKIKMKLSLCVINCMLCPLSLASTTQKLLDRKVAARV
jgi:hypothetical protein